MAVCAGEGSEEGSRVDRPKSSVLLALIRLYIEPHRNRGPHPLLPGANSTASGGVEAALKSLSSRAAFDACAAAK